MKKFIFGIITFAICIIMTQVNDVKAAVLTNVNGLELTDQNIEDLRSLGFTDEAIENMDEEEYQLNKDLKGEIVDTDTKYIKTITPEENSEMQPLEENEELQRSLPEKSLNVLESNNSISIELDEETFYKELEQEKTGIKTMASDTTTTDYKIFKTTISKLSSSKYRLTNNMTWKKIPSTRQWDVSGVGINSTYWAPVPNSQYAKQNWKTYSHMSGNQSGSSTYKSSSSYWSKKAGGYALKMNLPNNTTNGADSKFVESLSNYMYYNVSKLASTKQLDAYGAYRHQATSASIGISYSISGSSLSVSPSTKFDGPITTHAQVKF
ncbi:hypothetical protein QNH26_20575 [Peribacillus frigoritolerans]|uniref:hypothetical protein n=1 Tax=Peribacillus frigoritolerans TaxID=450367 RepID=UPI0024C192B7|nr:hypothetical protein [Peribacillus frigoritolerans]WHX66038.1 hypothetical protein QNH26_20575 [Peribacillus frigoritolerans]